MRYWQSITMEPLDQRTELSQAAERLGFTGVVVGDHLITPANLGSSYPYTRDGKLLWNPEVLFPDPWQTISAMAAVTTRLKFMTSIYILPLRDVFTVAKALSTAAVISNNRVIFGAGVGWMKEEFDLTGQKFENRGARTDEMLEIIAALLRGGMVEYHGRHYDFPPVQMSPTPNVPVPTIIGGESDAALRRAAKADGWISSPHEPAELGVVIERFKAARRALARSDTPIIVALLKGQVDIEDCLALSDLGVTDIILPNTYLAGDRNRSLKDKLEMLEKRAEEIVIPSNGQLPDKSVEA